ncbi:MAG: polysaccharide deacetylase family protein [Polyangiaceae bacterium]
MIAALSVDLDEIPHYHAIHGLPPPSAQSAHLVYQRALGRIEDFARAHELPVTFFAIGVDLTGQAGAGAGAGAALRVLALRGHAVENHSLCHRYDFSRLPPAQIAAEVEDGAAAIAAAVGSRPTGFRAPGYLVSDAVFDALDEAGVAFDSSVFPCPPYWAAKAAVLAAMRLRGRASSSRCDDPRGILAPPRPDPPGARWFQRGGARRFVELPVQVTPRARLPFIGTSLAMAGERGARWLARSLRGEPLVNLELHGIDFLDASDGLEALIPVQPDLRKPLGARLDALSAAVAELGRQGRAWVRLDEAAAAHAS